MIENVFQQDFHGQTTLHPQAMTFLLICGILSIVLPRRFAIWPLVVACCFISPAQRLVVATLDFTLIRVLVLCIFARVAVRQEFHIRWNLVDYLMLVWATISVVMPSMTNMSQAVLVNKLGYAFDAVGLYFAGRFLLSDLKSFKTFVLGLVVVAIPVAILFSIEKSTGRNLFSVLGGVPEFTLVRNGRLRVQGAFAHPILAGCFWAGVLPLVVAQRWLGWPILITALALALLLVPVMLTSSSTPVMAVIFCLVGALFWIARFHMRYVKIGLLFMLVSLHLVMHKPVWHLIARIDFVGGSTGWHRYHLIDQAINHSHEWILFGSTRGTAHWGWGLEDATNFYVVQGLHGGILQLLLFVALIAAAFAQIGKVTSKSTSSRQASVIAWCVGVALFTHVMNFLAVSYFGQIFVMWYLTLALAASLPVLFPATASLTRPLLEQQRRLSHLPARRPALY